MEFRATDEIPHRYGDLVFRESRLTKGSAVVLFLALTLAALSVALSPELIPSAQGLPRFVPFVAAGALLIFTLVSLFTFRASLRSSNWLVRFDRRKLYLKFRSYLNAHLPGDDPVVAVLDPDEIEWIRKTTARRVVPGGRGDERAERWTYLDLGLSADTNPLQARLREERRREAPMVRRTPTKAEH